jgi:hypothetical protein
MWQSRYSNSAARSIIATQEDGRGTKRKKKVSLPVYIIRITAAVVARRLQLSLLYGAQAEQ